MTETRYKVHKPVAVVGLSGGPVQTTALLQHKAERLQCDRGSGSIGHRLATSSPPRRGASQLLQLLYGDDHTAAGTRAPFRGFQGALASQLRSDIKHERPCVGELPDENRVERVALVEGSKVGGAEIDLRAAVEYQQLDHHARDQVE